MKLADYLIEKKLSFAAFARMLGIEGNGGALNVSRYARGLRHPRPAIAHKIVKVTKNRVTLKDIYSVEDAE